MKEGTLKIDRDEMSGLDATPELDPAEVLGVRIPACITRVYAEAPTFSSFATAFTIGKSPLRQACHDFQQLADDGAESGAMSADLVTIATRAFRLACDNKTSKLCEPALEGLKLLCATGMIAGSTKAWAPKPKDAPSDENDKDENDKDDASKTDEEQKKEDELVSLVTAVAKCGEVSSSSTHVACVACISSMAESKSFALRGESLATAARTLLHLSVAALSDDDQVAAKAALVRVINEAFARAEPSFSSRDGESDEAIESIESIETNETIESSDESDALLLTLTLCAIAAKPLDGSNDEYKSHSRVLAMDLIRQLLEGPVAGAWLARWRVHLRKPLCVAVLRAGAGGLDRDGSVQALETRYLGVVGSNPGGVVGSGNPSPKVAKALAPLRALARAAFGVVIIKARKSYKREISALYAPLALAPLEGTAAQSNADTNTDPDHQLVALRLVRKLASDPQVLVDVFVNYDCDLNGENLYERTLGALAGAMTPGKGPKQAVRNGALQCVLAMVQSLRLWHARGEAGGELGESDELKENGGSLRTDPATPVKDTSGGKTDAAEADSEANKFHQMKARKASVEAAVAAFNARPKLTSLENCPDLKTDDPTQVASFLLTAKGLDKTAIGELLGGFDDDEVAVMRAFVESHDFAQDDFDVALRRFMSSFRLPGEAQKIDRLMEAFAARYCEGNPDVFKDRDAAYVLAFAVIMLNTDAHNPNMDTKMTKKDFVDMATSAESGSGMDQAMLETVYDRIVSEEIVMKDEPVVNRDGARKKSLGKSLNLATPWARRDTVSAARAKSETVMKETRSLYTANDGSESTEYEPAFHAASEPGLARPMLDAASTPLLGALRKAFECAEDAGHAALPLECARAAFRLANRVQLPEMRDQLAAFLTSAPGIGGTHGMAPQGAEAVMTLLEVAVGESGMPGTCWAAVLEVVSGLDELHAAAHGGCGIPAPGGARADEGVSINASIAVVQSPTSSSTSTPGAGLEASRTPLGPVSRASRTASGVTSAALSEYPLAPGTSGHMNVDSAPGSPSAVNTTNGPTSAEKNLNSAEKNLAAWLGGAGADAVERVFSGSTRLDSEEIVVFTQALAHVASAELTRPDGSSRTFSLRKLVHVVTHNSGRVRLAWSRVWGVASECLVKACAHADDDVVAVAAGGLKEVAYRVLSNAPVSSDRSDVLKPFVSAFKAANGQSDQSRCAIADALGSALADGNGLALGVTGWRSVLEVLEIASADLSRSVALSALRGVSTAVVETNREKPNALVDCDAVRAIARFAYIPHEGTADGDQSMAVSAVSPLDATSLRLVELSAETLRDVAVDAGRALSSSPYANDSSNRTGDEPSEPPLDDRERAMGTWRVVLASLADVAAGDRLSSSPHANDSTDKSLFSLPPPEPALRGLFEALDAFVGGGEDVVQLPADAWKVAADVAIKPTVDMESRRLRLLETTRTSAGEFLFTNFHTGD